MTAFVDDVRHRFGRMIMCHMWADSLHEMLTMADRIGVQRKWLQQPPKASWVHFDISLGMKDKALAAGAVLTDKYGPAEFVAAQRSSLRSPDMLKAIIAARAKRNLPPDGILKCPPGHTRYTLPDGRVFHGLGSYYLASCDDCGWVGSSGLCGTSDDDVICPLCHRSGADCGRLAATAVEAPT